MRSIRWQSIVASLIMVSRLATPASPQVASGKTDPEGLDLAQIEAALPEYFRRASGVRGGAQPADLPDVFGPGAVLRAGDVHMKVTNWGHCGNLFTNLSSDPAGQWPGDSGIEYLSSIRLAVGAVNPEATDPTAVRRVSYLLEWRPPTLDPADRIYQAYDGIINGQRFVDDDSDGKIDEDRLDGHDNDGDGKIDEDYGALGQQMYACVMRDDTPQAINATFNEKHVPLGLECYQLAWAYSVPGFTNFDVIEYTITNVSGHTLDSLTVGWLVDMDCGPVVQPNYFLDDFDLPQYLSGEFRVPTPLTDGRLQSPHAPIQGVSQDSALCSAYKVRVNGFSIADDDGDQGRTPGIPTFLLLDHTIDPLGINGPSRVGFRAYRSFTAGTPYAQGGNPIIDQQRFEFMTSTQNVDPQTGFINAPPGDQKGDQVAWCSIGPWKSVPSGGQIKVTVAFAVAPGDYRTALGYANDYARYQAGLIDGASMVQKYRSLDNALAAQIAFEGAYEQRAGFPVPDFHGRETPLKAPPGQLLSESDCHDLEPRLVTDQDFTWFDFDCDYCTGAYDYTRGVGLFHHTWLASTPPPNPDLNTAVSYNYSDNPSRRFPPAGDHQVTLAWDNLSEVTPDPKTGWFDFRGYQIWKVSDWKRPVGAAGPAENDWSLLADFRLFDSSPDNRFFDPDSGRLVCPKIYVADWYDSTSHTSRPAMVPICLMRGDLWDRQTGMILRPDIPLDCVRLPNGRCDSVTACQLGRVPCLKEGRVRYPIGRYRLIDREVKNGFVYFYSVTAYDSTGVGPTKSELVGRHSAVEAEGVVPQAATRRGLHAWVVPNPYRGYARLDARPSAWDLTPDASDPTGTHVDFMGMPRVRWTLRIYTVSGDLVQTIKSSDQVNQSQRAPVTGPNGHTYPGFNRQQDTPDDGEASWNLISRSGQDVVSGIYIFAVESDEGVQRGRFVIIR